MLAFFHFPLFFEGGERQVMLLGFQTEKRLEFVFLKKVGKIAVSLHFNVSQIARKSIAKPSTTMWIVFSPSKSRSWTWEMKCFLPFLFPSFAGAVDVGGRTPSEKFRCERLGLRNNGGAHNYLSSKKGEKRETKSLPPNGLTQRSRMKFGGAAFWRKISCFLTKIFLPCHLTKMWWNPAFWRKCKY